MTKETFRAVVLAALMVLSVVAVASPAAAATTTDVTLERDGSGTVSTGSTVTYDIVLQTADNGVGAFDNITVSVNDTSVAEITSISTDVGSGANSDVESDGSSAWLNLPFGGDTNNTGSVTIVTVEMSATGEGTAALDLTVTGDIADEGGSLYTIQTVSDATLTVSGVGGPPSGLTDNTADANVTRTQQIEVADLDFSNPGRVENVTVNLVDGDTATALVSDVSTTTVVLYSGGTQVGSQQATYDSADTVVEFGNVTDVDRIQVLATATSDATAGNDIDATVTATAPNGASTSVDTAGTQSITAESFVSAEVRDLNGNPITTDDDNVTVDFINVNTGRTIKSDVRLNDRGETQRIVVGPGTYKVEVTGGNFFSSSTRGTVAEGETLELDVTLQSRLVADQLDATPETATAIADGQDTITYTVTVWDQNGDLLPDAQVEAEVLAGTDLTFVETDSDGDGHVDGITDSNGEVTFTLSSDTIQTADIRFFAEGGNQPEDEVEAVFQPLRGDESISGFVDDNESQALEGLTVWAAYPGGNQTLAFAQENREFLVDTTDADGHYSIVGLVGNNTDVNVYVSGQTADGRTVEAHNMVQTAPAGDWTEEVNFVVTPFERALEYQVNVTAVESTIASGDSTEVEITVTARPVGTTQAFTPTSTEVDLSLDDSSLGSLSASQVQTNSDGEATVTFTAADDVSGIVEVNGSVTNSEGDTFSDTDTIEIVTTVVLEGDITDATTSEPLEDIQIQAFKIFANGTVADSESAQQFSIQSGDVALEVESGFRYRVEATDPAGDYEDAATVVDARGAVGTVAFSIALQPADDSNGDNGNSGTFLGALDDAGDSDGTVDFDEVLDAISAFNNDGSIGGFDVTFPRVLDAISAFNEGTSV